MKDIFAGFGAATKSLVAGAGGPIATLLNPNAMKAIGENVSILFAALPPAPIVAQGVMSMVRSAVVETWTASAPSEAFMEKCRASGKFPDDAAIVAYRNLLLEEI